MNSKNCFVLLGVIILLISYLGINQITYFSENTNLNEVNIKNRNYSFIKSSLPITNIIKINNELLLGSGMQYPQIYFTKEYLSDPINDDSLFLYNIKKKELQKLTIENFPEGISFHPQGISLYKTDSEIYYLLIINHSINFEKQHCEERIEKVLLKINRANVSLEFKNSIILPQQYFGTLNSVAMINLNTIYFTTHNYFPLPFGSFGGENILNMLQKNKFKLYGYLNILLQKLNIKKTYLYSYNLDSGKINAIQNSEGTSNYGLAFNEDKSILYMARSFEKDIKVFEISRNDPTKALLINTVKTIYNVGNIFYDNKKEKIYAGIYGTNMELINLEKSYIQEENFDKVTTFGGFEEIDIKNKYEISDIILMKNGIKGISSAIKINDDIYLSSLCQNGILIYHKN
jgi:hypothetical protein